MYWDKEYGSKERIWGDSPSELALVALNYLQSRDRNKRIHILDIGCGYGRDANYLVNNLNCRITGIDISQKAIDIATDSVTSVSSEFVQFRCLDFRELQNIKFDVVCASNLYQVLRPHERTELRQTIEDALNPGGLLFLGTLSVNDPQHHGKGTPIPHEPNSFQDRIYLHLCTGEELEKDFSRLRIVELYEHEYNEVQSVGEDHHHISWILIGEFKPF